MKDVIIHEIGPERGRGGGLSAARSSSGRLALGARLPRRLGLLPLRRGGDVGVSPIGGGLGGARRTSPNKSPQTDSSSTSVGDGGGCDRLGMRNPSGDAHYSATRPQGIALPE